MLGDLEGHRNGRTWVGDGRFLRDTTTGTIGGQPFWRIGFLGYATWSSASSGSVMDGINAAMMFYQGAPGSGFGPIDVTGSFVDQGVLGERYSGKALAMRTEIPVRSADAHVFDIYFTPPGEEERLTDRNVYVRID